MVCGEGGGGGGEGVKKVPCTCESLKEKGFAATQLKKRNGV